MLRRTHRVEDRRIPAQVLEAARESLRRTALTEEELAGLSGTQIARQLRARGWCAGKHTCGTTRAAPVTHAAALPARFDQAGLIAAASNSIDGRRAHDRRWRSPRSAHPRRLQAIVAETLPHCRGRANERHERKLRPCCCTCGDSEGNAPPADASRPRLPVTSDHHFLHGMNAAALPHPSLRRSHSRHNG